MFYRIPLTALVLTCTLIHEPTHALGLSTAKHSDHKKDLICVLILSGVGKEDLDVTMVTKLREHNLNPADLNNRTIQRECFAKSTKVELHKTKQGSHVEKQKSAEKSQSERRVNEEDSTTHSPNLIDYLKTMSNNPQKIKVQLQLLNNKDDKEMKHGRKPPSDLLQMAPAGKSPSFDNIYKYLYMDTKPHHVNMTAPNGLKSCTDTCTNSTDNNHANTPKKLEEDDNFSDLSNSKPADEGIGERVSKKELEIQISTEPTDIIKEAKHSEESTTAKTVDEISLHKMPKTKSNHTGKPGKKMSIYNVFNDFLPEKSPDMSTNDNNNAYSFPEADGRDTEKKAIRGKHRHGKSKNKSKTKKIPSHLLQEITNTIKNSVLKDLRTEIPKEYQQSMTQEEFKNKLKDVPHKLIEALTKEIKTKILRDLKKDITDHVKESVTEEAVSLKDKDSGKKDEQETEGKLKTDATTPEETRVKPKHHKRKHITITKTTMTTERPTEKRIENETAEQSEETDKNGNKPKSFPYNAASNYPPPGKQDEQETEGNLKKDAITPEETRVKPKHHKHKHITTTTTTTERQTEKRIEIETAEQSDETDKKEPTIKRFPYNAANNYPPTGVFTVKKYTDTTHASQYAQAGKNVIYNSIPFNFQKLPNFPPLPALVTSTPGNGQVYPARGIPGYPGIFNPFTYNSYPQAMPQPVANNKEVRNGQNQALSPYSMVGKTARVVSVPSSTVLVTTISTTTTRRPTTAARTITKSCSSPSTTTESADNKKAENTMVLDKLSQLFEQIKTLKAKIDNPTNKKIQVTETKVVSQGFLTSGGGRMPINSFNHQTGQISRVSGHLAPTMDVYNKRDPYVVDMPQSVPAPSRPAAPRHVAAMTIQTNSYVIPPLGIALKVKKTPFGTMIQNQNIVVISTRRPYSSDEEWDNARTTHHRMDHSAFKPAYETIPMTYHNKKTNEALRDGLEEKDQVNLDRFQLRYNPQSEAEKYSPKFAHPKGHPEPDLYEPLHEYRPKHVNLDSYLAEQHWNIPKSFGASGTKHRSTHVTDPPLKEFKEPTYMDSESEHRLKHFSDTTFEKRPEHHHKKQLRLAKHHFSHLDMIDSRERDRKISSLEKTNAHKVKVPQRQQVSIKKRPSTYDDTHFNNFIKTQQKVNAMLERILATKPKTSNNGGADGR